MALPASGQLTYSAIANEIYGSVGTNRSMYTMATAASKPTSNASVSNFYSYSHGDNIVIAFGSTTAGTNYGYWTVTHAGHTSPQIIRIDFDFSGQFSPGYGEVHWRENSGSWNTVSSGTSTHTSTSWSVFNIDYNDVIEVGWEGDKPFFQTVYGNISVYGRAITSGSGSISGYPGRTL